MLVFFLGGGGGEMEHLEETSGHTERVSNSHTLKPKIEP